MQISDLSYLENVPEDDLILGSAGVLVNAMASALGDSTATLALTDAKTRLLPSGVSIGFGRGLAVAVGDNPQASVTVAGSGDIVVGRTKSISSQDTAVARGFVLVVDL